MFTVTYYGYASVLLHLEKLILIDPGIIQGQPQITPDQVHASHVLVTHSHTENMGNAASFANTIGSLVLGNSQVAEELSRQNVKGYCIEQIQDGTIFDAGADITIKTYALRHGGFLAPRNIAYLISSPQGSTLHLGHTKEYEALRNTQPDLLCVPIAGKKTGTFGPTEAAEATNAIQPRYTLPICSDSNLIGDYFTLLTEQGSPANQVAPAHGETITIL